MLINKQDEPWDEQHHRTPEPLDSPFSNRGKAEEALVTASVNHTGDDDSLNYN